MSKSHEVKNTSLKIPLEQIVPDPDNPRLPPGEDKDLPALAESIKQYGLIHAIVVRRVADSYQIVAGERRWHAIKMLEWTHALCVVVDCDAITALEIQANENLQRLDMSFVQQSAIVGRIVDAHGGDQKAAAEAISRSAAYVSQRMSLRQLGPVGTDLVSCGALKDWGAISGFRRLERDAPVIAAQLAEQAKTSGQLTRSSVDAACAPIRANTVEIWRVNHSGGWSFYAASFSVA